MNHRESKANTLLVDTEYMSYVYSRESKFNYLINDVIYIRNSACIKMFKIDDERAKHGILS